jgi:flagellin
MPQIINTNVASLNGSNATSPNSQGVTGHLDAAPVLGPADQLGQGRRGRPGDRRTHERPGAWHERRDPQRQRRHLPMRRPLKARLSKVGDALQRMRELAVQARNSTNSSNRTRIR